MSTPTVDERFRIIVGLAAIFQKPPSQSLAAYIVDLQDRFALGGDPEPSKHHPWREQCLKLEEDVDRMQVKIQRLTIGASTDGQRDCIPSLTPDPSLELRKLREGTTETAEPSTQSSSSNKKRKKDQSMALTILDTKGKPASLSPPEKWTVPDHLAKWAPALCDSLDILSSYRSLKLTKAARKTIDADWNELILPNTQRTLRALHNLLALCLSSDGKLLKEIKGQNKSMLLDHMFVLFWQLLATLSSFRLTRNTLEPLLPQIASLVVTPAIRSIFSQSVSVVTQLTVKPKSSRSENNTSTIERTPPQDLRPSLWRLLDYFLNWAGDQKLLTRDLVEIVFHECINELDKLFRNRDASDSALEPLGTRQQRIERLARKDTAWYLCGLLQMILDLPTIGDVFLDTFLSSASFATLTSLVGMLTKGQPYGGHCGELERDMLLALVEKIWLNRLGGTDPLTQDA